MSSSCPPPRAATVGACSGGKSVDCGGSCCTKHSAAPECQTQTPTRCLRYRTALDLNQGYLVTAKESGEATRNLTVKNVDCEIRFAR
jgi:hypothetical protein